MCGGCENCELSHVDVRGNEGCEVARGEMQLERRAVERRADVIGDMVVAVDDAKCSAVQWLGDTKQNAMVCNAMRLEAMRFDAIVSIRWTGRRCREDGKERKEKGRKMKMMKTKMKKKQNIDGTTEEFQWQQASDLSHQIMSVSISHYSYTDHVIVKSCHSHYHCSGSVLVIRRKQELEQHQGP